MLELPRIFNFLLLEVFIVKNFTIRQIVNLFLVFGTFLASLNAHAGKIELLSGVGTVSVFDSTSTPDSPSPQLFVNQPGIILPQGGVAVEAIALTGNIPGNGITTGVSSGSLFWKVDEDVTGIARINVVGSNGNTFPFIEVEIGSPLEIKGHSSRYIAPGELLWIFPTFSFSAGIDEGDFSFIQLFGNNISNGNGFDTFRTFANFRSSVDLTVNSITVVSSVPEPETWLLLITGLILIVYLKKDRKSGMLSL